MVSPESTTHSDFRLDSWFISEDLRGNGSEELRFGKKWQGNRYIHTKLETYQWIPSIFKQVCAVVPLRARTRAPLPQMYKLGRPFNVRHLTLNRYCIIYIYKECKTCVISYTYVCELTPPFFPSYVLIVRKCFRRCSLAMSNQLKINVLKFHLLNNL